MSDRDLGDIISDLSDHTTDKARPFTGQSHTDQGERGKTEVRGIRFRDLADCAVRAFVDSCPEAGDEMRNRRDDGTLNYNDLFTLDIEEMDPVAFIQNLTCQVEKTMAIFPNLPKGQGGAG